jgi:hypothetical protein
VIIVLNQALKYKKRALLTFLSTKNVSKRTEAGQGLPGWHCLNFALKKFISSNQALDPSNRPLRTILSTEFVRNYKTLSQVNTLAQERMSRPPDPI